MAKVASSSIISLSLPENILREMDETVIEMGYGSRSELIRDSLRAFMKEKVSVKSMKGRVDGLMIIVYDHDRAHDISEVRHEHMSVFRSFLHTDFDSGKGVCCEVMVVSGDGERVREAFFDLKSMKGVREAQIFMASGS